MNDPAIFWAAVGAVATVLALLVALVAVWPLIRTRRNRAKEAVISFMADLSMRHVLFEPVGVESPVPASTSLEEIRTGAAQLYGVLTDKRSKKAAAGIREASREAALAIRQERRMPGVPEVLNWFTDDLNVYRDQIRPLVEALCNHYRIGAADRPQIRSYMPGFASPPMKEGWIPAPDQEVLDRLEARREDRPRLDEPADVTRAGCEWGGCSSLATHTVQISFPEGNAEEWRVCRAHDRVLKVAVPRSRPKASPAPETPLITKVCCGECGRDLDEASAPETGERPCPDCGSVKRLVKVEVSASATVHSWMRLQGRQEGKGGWITEVKTGDSYSADLEAWSTRELMKDRATDTYREVFVLYDGTRLESTARLRDHHD